MRNSLAKVSQLRDLVRIRKNERHAAKSNALEARLAEQKAEAVLNSAKSNRDDAVQNWENCRQSDHIDLGLEPIRARHLLDREARVNQTEALLSLALERLESKQLQWKQSDLNLKTSETMSNGAERRLTKKREEQQLAELNDLHCYRQVRK